MVVKVYISGISGNKEVKKRQQRVLMILESKNIPFEVVDITEPGKEAEKDFMQTNSTSLGITVSDINPRHPLPPQMFNDAEYCGDYEQFDLANEIDTLEQFLKVEPPSEPQQLDDVTKEEVVQNSVSGTVEAVLEQMETNGLPSSREASVEAESKTNGVDQSETNEDNEDEKEKDDIVVDISDLKKNSTDLILNEQTSAE